MAYQRHVKDNAQSCIRETNLIERAKRYALHAFRGMGLRGLDLDGASADTQSTAWELLNRHPEYPDKRLIRYAILRVVHANSRIADSGETAEILDDCSTPAPTVTAVEIADWLSRLTDQQRLVCKLMENGDSVAEIAVALGVTDKRVYQIRESVSASWAS